MSALSPARVSSSVDGSVSLDMSGSDSAGRRLNQAAGLAPLDPTECDHDTDTAPLLTRQEDEHGLVQRVSPTSAAARRSGSPGTAPTLRSPHQPPVHYPLARVSSPINYNTAQFVLLIFLTIGVAYIIWDAYHPSSQHHIKYLPTESIPKVPSTIPVSRFDYDGWTSRVGDIDRDLAAGAHAKLLFVGDSITQGWLEAGSDVWRTAFSSSAVNLGVGGDQTQHVLWRLLDGHGGELSKVGDEIEVVVLMIGTNNSRWSQPASETVLGVLALVRALRARLGAQPHILVLFVFPRGDFLAPFKLNQQVNSALRIAIEHVPDGVFVYDLSAHFMADRRPLDTSQVDQLPDIDAKLYNPDRLHLASAGYSAWREALQPILERHQKLVRQSRQTAGGQAAPTATPHPQQHNQRQ